MIDDIELCEGIHAQVDVVGLGRSPAVPCESNCTRPVAGPWAVADEVVHRRAENGDVDPLEITGVERKRQLLKGGATRVGRLIGSIDVHLFLLKRAWRDKVPLVADHRGLSRGRALRASLSRR